MTIVNQKLAVFFITDEIINEYKPYLLFTLLVSCVCYIVINSHLYVFCIL